VEFLSNILSQGKTPIEDVKKAARSANVTPKSLRSAREALGIKSKRDGFGPGAVYSWSLPESPCLPSTPMNAHVWKRANMVLEGKHVAPEAPKAPKASSVAPSAAETDYPDIPPFLRREPPVAEPTATNGRAPALGPPGDSLDDFQ
jgi:hypothetical protein